MSYETTRSDLEALFAEAGQIVEVFLPTDRDTGRIRGFAFVEYTEGNAVSKAVEKFNGHEFKGRTLRVTQAEEQPKRSPNFSSSTPDSGYQGPKRSKSKGSRRNIRAAKRGH